MTNIIAYLHTTLAYQSAAMHLMVGQADFEARQLHLTEPLPIVAPASTNNWTVAMPPDGVTGRLATTNYFYQFQAGKLFSIIKRPLGRGAIPNPAESQPSLIDTNDAYQLATQWLAAISVDVPALESKYAHSVMQFGARTQGIRNRSSASATNNLKSPVFRVTWGGPHGRQPGSNRTDTPITMEILGSTKQCTGLRIQNLEFLKSPPLLVTNAAALLGTPPPPQHFVEEFLGGKAAYAAVAQPDKVTAWLFSSPANDPA